MAGATVRRRHGRRRTGSGTVWRQCLYAVLIVAATSLLSIYVLLPKGGDPLMAVFVGLTILLGPAAWLKGSDDDTGAGRRRR
jgi:hypothetical protein